MDDDKLEDIAAAAQMGALLSQTIVDLLAGRGVISGDDAIAIYNRVALQAEEIGGPLNEKVAASCRRLAEVYQKRPPQTGSSHQGPQKS